jgi:murein DD-endopeptidase MepM/ murein hydrolase activator NlpD
MRISVPVARLGSTTAKFVITAVTAALLAGCSDSIDRFSQNYNNPSDADPVYTASVPKYKKAVSPRYAKPKALAYNEEVIVQSPIASGPVYKAKAPAFDYTTSYKKPFKQPEVALNSIPDAPVYKAPIYKKKIYAQPVVEEQQAQIETVAPVTPAVRKLVYKKPVFQAEAAIVDEPKVAVASPKTMSTVRVGNGMTLYSLAKANGLSVQQLATANNIDAPYTVSAGRVLRIPGSHVAQLPAAKSEPLVQEEQAAVAVAKPTIKLKAAGNHVVASGDTLFSLGRKFGVSPFAIADLNGLSHSRALSLGQQLRIPGGAKVQTAPVAEENIVDNSASDVPSKKVAPLALPNDQPALKQVAEVPTDATALSMRWPVKGKVISGYGAKPNGLKNEGINIAVPEGTSIRAAESGVVAYAGNELKGYGNLILIRHAGGYVTAYAHAKTLNVKRGDTVKRGDVIAISGQTGAVQSPQLHFEVRKGASALDPNKYLSSSTAMN